MVSIIVLPMYPVYPVTSVPGSDPPSCSFPMGPHCSHESLIGNGVHPKVRKFRLLNGNKVKRSRRKVLLTPDIRGSID
jgi:hypothetical protein